MPEAVALAASSAIGSLLARLVSRQASVVRENLAHVVPEASSSELDRLVRRAFSSYGRYWADLARLRPDSDLGGGRFCLDDRGLLAEVLAGGPAILALPHLGSWEMGGLYLARAGHPLTTVAEELRPPELFEWFVEQREQLGIHVLPLRPETTAKLLAVLGAGGMLALIADRDITGDGIEVSFFGQTTRVPAGPAILALRTGAPLYPTAIYHGRDGRHRAVIRPAIDTTRVDSLRQDLQRVSQALVHELEILIRAAPEQWHVFQPNWPARAERLEPQHPPQRGAS